jgi:hypothetical protein
MIISDYKSMFFGISLLPIATSPLSCVILFESSFLFSLAKGLSVYLLKVTISLLIFSISFLVSNSITFDSNLIFIMSSLF